MDCSEYQRKKMQNRVMSREKKNKTRTDTEMDGSESNGKMQS